MFLSWNASTVCGLRRQRADVLREREKLLVPLEHLYSKRRSGIGIIVGTLHYNVGRESRFSTVKPAYPRIHGKEFKLESTRIVLPGKRRRDLDDPSSMSAPFSNRKVLGRRGLAAPGGRPAKTLTIKPFKHAPSVPQDYESKTWESLRSAVEHIYKKESMDCSLQQLYTNVENLCSQNKAKNEDLYNKLRSECSTYISKKGSELARATPDLRAFLLEVDKHWMEHCQQMKLIQSIFCYLDRTYVINYTAVRSLWVMGLELFRDQVMQQGDVLRKSVNGLLQLIEQERKRESVDRSLIRKLLRMLIDLGLYKSSFEQLFLDQSEKFYSAEGHQMIESTDTADFLRHTVDRLQEESERVQSYLDPQTKGSLIRIFESQMLAEHSSTILEKGFNTLMDADRIEDLKRMFNLLGRVHKLAEMQQALGGYIKMIGSGIVGQEDGDKDMVQRLLTFKDRLDRVLKEAFHEKQEFYHCVKDSFESVVNVRLNKPAELIAKYIDHKLRARTRDLTEDELEVLMDKLIALFRFISSKDVFEAFYKKDLAKRLLFGKSASIDAEKSMISKLKVECGASFTNKLEGMFKDMELSKDIMASFKESREGRSLHGIDLAVSILTTVYWPSYDPIEVVLPPGAAAVQDSFKSFYIQKYQGRRLVWQNTLGHATLRIAFKEGRKELLVSLFQAVVLMLFNEKDKYTMKEIADLTRIEQKELTRALLSLSIAGIRILKKHPKVKEVAPDDTYTFNDEFKSPRVRIKVNAIQLEETTEEHQQTEEGIFQDRQYQVDAAVVRIMKARKTLKHQVLMAELYKQLKFPVKASDLKKRIESLIEREYLERDSDDSDTYQYLA